ncbi:DUF4249 domain-containing protein [Muricauda sp. SCSIO 64092]|uniref:DUF4249 family protein n=1 Tax=Allomuricauda sp. SCSIO 64092 TaxID=2908842 RepID=UPI001FF62736|nr:DUF4249 family protein [Muricauda sp. SCSIO 64092]UOY06963.1 DUF4249 domain-containing protein [Muricauda sp. SCSIO 64092]
MKRTLFLLAVVSIIVSCEDVIDVETQPEPSRLVVNGLVRVDVTQEFVDVRIVVTETSDFFNENTITQLESAVILLGRVNPDALSGVEFGGTSVLEESEPGSGVYIPSYIPGSDTDDRIRTAGLSAETAFLLIIEHKGRRYAAQTLYAPAVPIDNIEQGDETLFDEDDTEIKITITDIPDADNYYVFDFGGGEFLALDDQFIDGQEFEFSYFPDRDLDPGDEVEVSILGADQEFFNYIDLLVEQTENDGGVFETPAATVRGNVFDITGLDNIEIFDNVERPNEFALGYFAFVQEFTETITIE